MKKVLVSFIWVLIVGIGFVLLEMPAFAQEPIVWKLQSGYSAVSGPNKVMLPKFKEEIEKRSKGRLVIKVYDAGALVKSLEIFNALKKGVLQATCSAGVYHARIMPEGNIETGLTMTFEDKNQAIEYFYKYNGGEGIRIYRDIYNRHGVYLLNIYPYCNYVVMTTFPINTLEDLKGKKIRASGARAAHLKKLGMVPLNILGAEQYMALQRGTIDANTHCLYALGLYKLQEVVDYVMLPPIETSITVNTYVNQDAWNNLPDDLKKIVTDVGNEIVPWVAKELEEADEQYMAEAKEKGVKFVRLAKEDVVRLRETGMEVWDEFRHLKNCPDCKRLIDSLETFLRGKGVIK